MSASLMSETKWTTRREIWTWYHQPTQKHTIRDRLKAKWAAKQVFKTVKYLVKISPCINSTNSKMKEIFNVSKEGTYSITLPTVHQMIPPNSKWCNSPNSSQITCSNSKTTKKVTRMKMNKLIPCSNRTKIISTTRSCKTRTNSEKRKSDRSNYVMVEVDEL